MSSDGVWDACSSLEAGSRGVLPPSGVGMKSSSGVRASVEVKVCCVWRSDGGAWDVGGREAGAEGPREAWFICAGSGWGAGGVERVWAEW